MPTPSEKVMSKRGETAGLRVLHALAPAEFGGLESVVQLLAAGQRSVGVDVRVALVLDERGSHPLVESLSAAGVPVFPIRVALRRYLREMRSLAGAFREIGPHIVHTHGYRADVLAGIVARRQGRPTVTTVHGFTGGGLKNRLYERLQRLVIRRADAVIAVSRPLVARLIGDGISEDRLFLVPNAWMPSCPLLEPEQARASLSIPSEAYSVGWVGRLSHEKGPDVLLDAASELPGSVSVSFVGGGPMLDQLRERQRSLGVDACVHWHGPVAGARRLFGAFDCFVLSSRTEGTPMVLFEAMEAEVPIVAADVGGVPDVVSPAECLLVRPDDPSVLAAAIHEVMQHPERARERAHRAKERLRAGFDLQTWLDRHEEVYGKVIRRQAAEGSR